MYNGKTIVAVIVAAGSGQRMGSIIPKQFLEIGGKPILLKTAEAFEQSLYVDGFFVVAQEEYIKQVESVLSGMTKFAGAVCGGNTRQESVYAGLSACKEKYDLVVIHDGARPFVSQEIIEAVIQTAEKTGAAVPSVAVKDTVKTTTDGITYEKTLDRDSLRGIQTPQGFKTELIQEAYDKAVKDNFSGTDDSMLVERLGYKVSIIEGSYENIKITTKEDMPMDTRVGTGFDVHRFQEGRDLILGGMKIPYERGLLGHSDADVLLHAVMDSLLGAAGLGDIGKHFPDTDMRYKDVSSMVLLEEVIRLIGNLGYKVGNIDATIIAQEPKMMKYMENMKENIASKAGISPDKVNVKATTTEKLGFTGRGEGIAAEAVCIIYK